MAFKYDKTTDKNGGRDFGDANPNIGNSLHSRNGIVGHEYVKTRAFVPGGKATTWEIGEFTKTIIEVDDDYRYVFNFIDMGIDDAYRYIQCGDPVQFATADSGEMLRATSKLAALPCANKRGLALGGSTVGSLDERYFAAVSSQYVYYKGVLFKLQHSAFGTDAFFHSPSAIVGGYLLVNFNPTIDYYQYQRLYAIPISRLESIAKARGYKSIGDVPVFSTIGQLKAYLDTKAVSITIDDYYTGYESLNYETLVYIVAGEASTTTLYTLNTPSAGLDSVDTYTLNTDSGGVVTVAYQSSNVAEKVYSGSAELVVSSGTLAILVDGSTGPQTIDTTKTFATVPASTQDPPVVVDTADYDSTTTAYHYNASYTQTMQYGWGRTYAADTYVFTADRTVQDEVFTYSGSEVRTTTVTQSGDISRTSEIPLVCDEVNEVQAWLAVVYAPVDPVKLTPVIISMTLHVRAGQESGAFEFTREIYVRSGTFVPAFAWTGETVSSCTYIGGVLDGCTGSETGTNFAAGEFNTASDLLYIASYPTPLLQKKFGLLYGSYHVVNDHGVLSLRTNTYDPHVQVYSALITSSGWLDVASLADQNVNVLVAFKITRDETDAVNGITEIQLADSFGMPPNSAPVTVLYA